MKRISIAVRSGLLGIGCLLLLGCFSAEAQPKSIRLRNETITTEVAPPVAVGAPAKTAGPPFSGLLLVQFQEGLTPARREQLRALGLDLLQYVPDDAFVARGRQVRLGELTALPFIRWAGAYRPEHKLHAALRQLPAGEARTVSVLLAADAAAPAVAGARKSLQTVLHEARFAFGTVLRGRATAGHLQALAESDQVLWIEPGPKMKLNDEIASRIVAGEGSPGRTVMMDLGYDGTGVGVAVADSGLDSGDISNMHPDIAHRVKALFYYGPNLTDAADEHSHGTHVAGIVAGSAKTGEMDDNGFLYGLGVAPGADLIGQRIFDGAGNYELTDPFETLTHDAKRAGADIGSNSWGDDTQGRYDLSAMEFDALVRDADQGTPGDQPYILEFSAGNSGPGQQTIGSPAVAKNVIATGAAQNDRPDLLIYGDGSDAMADFSSRGPCEDGRIKPDVTAPGTWIASLRSVYANDEFAWSPISYYYMYQGGTSQAGPHVSGAAAVFVQYWRATHTNATPSPALVKAALINSAVDMDETVSGAPLWDPEDGEPPPPELTSGLEMNPVPNMDEGWGRVDLTQLIGSTRGQEFLDQSVPLATGQQYERRVLVGSSDEPLKITLAYTDVPGFPGAIPALVNDLDLEVIAPNGSVFHGNQFNQGESVPEASVFDTINNVEGVHLAAPLPGEYLVRVRARNVVQDARADTGPVDQDFALVISAALAAPGVGIVTFNRPLYTAPSTIKLVLVDYNLAGQSTASLRLRSGTEMAGEDILLRAFGSTGLFTASVATVTGPVLSDGRLQISHGDTIEAVYEDGAPAATRVFTARADLMPPVISGVGVTNRFGRGHILWNTDEPATSLVVYGTNSSLGSVKTNRSFELEHEVTIDGQVSGRTYYFRLVCTDAAGNTSTNDNNGQLFSFVAPFVPAILVVDGFFGDAVYSPPPVENYTHPLDQLGLAYDVWSVETEGAPTVNDLRAYRVVLWRIAEANVGRPTGFTAAEQTAITQYLDGGGALFVASMEVLSRLGPGSAFARNVLHVSSFTEDVTVPEAEGVPDDPIGDGLYLTMDYSEYSIFGFEFDLSDTLTPGPGAEGILTETSSGDYVGLRYPGLGVDSPSRVVFLCFPFDAVPESDPAPDNRVTLLRRILLFLAPGLNGEGSLTFDRSAYTIPSRLTAEVADSDLEGRGQITIAISSDTEPTGQIVTLRETARRGVFRGSIALLATNSGSGEPELRVRPGDTVQAAYFDASVGASVSAAAEIEITPPTVTNIEVEPGYVDALIFWDTSEPAGSLVEFGESPRLGRTASDDASVDFHVVTLDQLQADSTYYFRIISRDRAGNVTVDDNNGQLYTFNTLRPLQPPWLDTLEHGTTNWTVYTSEDSERGWELGQPGFVSPPAHSPVSAWGSNLSGDYASQIETFLISPAILLTGGNRATLKFWHSYDFTYPSEYDIFHAGEVLLVTNNAISPIALGEFSDDLVDWEELEFDLSPYVGQIVYVVWHYFLFSIEALPRQGWLVDDISVSITNIIPGVVVVTNNLSQATFVLSGPINRNGAGNFLVITGAPPGQYVATFNAVPFFQTPAPQAGYLQSSNLLTFSGHYTFLDTNRNGIADDWERQYFGAAAPECSGNTLTNCGALLDSDLDGSPDFAEFVAGTVPTNRLSCLRLVPSEGPTNGTLQLTWQSAPGRSYRIAGSQDAVNWSPVTDWERAGAAGFVTRHLPVAANVPARFFRLEVRP